MFSAIVNACTSFFNCVKEAVKQFTKPETAVLAAGTGSDIRRSHKDLIAENVISSPTTHRAQSTGKMAEIHQWRSTATGFSISPNSILGQHLVSGTTRNNSSLG